MTYKISFTISSYLVFLIDTQTSVLKISSQEPNSAPYSCRSYLQGKWKCYYFSCKMQQHEAWLLLQSSDTTSFCHRDVSLLFFLKVNYSWVFFLNTCGFWHLWRKPNSLMNNLFYSQKPGEQRNQRLLAKNSIGGLAEPR